MDIVLDASPLIYLAKLDAFDAIAIAGHTAVVPPSVYAEAARPELAFRHPEIAIIERIRADGQLQVVLLDSRETELAIDLAARYGGLHAGELEVLALGQVRGWTVCFHERQAARLARALGVTTMHLVEILFAGTPDLDLLERRIRQFARLTNLTMNDHDVLLDVIQERRR
jgi:predicted nucleic acid-binding protein